VPGARAGAGSYLANESYVYTERSRHTSPSVTRRVSLARRSHTSHPPPSTIDQSSASRLVSIFVSRPRARNSNKRLESDRLNRPAYLFSRAPPPRRARPAVDGDVPERLGQPPIGGHSALLRRTAHRRRARARRRRASRVSRARGSSTDDDARESHDDARHLDGCTERVRYKVFSSPRVRVLTRALDARSSRGARACDAREQSRSAHPRWRAHLHHFPSTYRSTVPPYGFVSPMKRPIIPKESTDPIATGRRGEVCSVDSCAYCLPIRTPCG